MLAALLTTPPPLPWQNLDLGLDFQDSGCLATCGAAGIACMCAAVLPECVAVFASCKLRSCGEVEPFGAPQTPRDYRESPQKLPSDRVVTVWTALWAPHSKGHQRRPKRDFVIFGFFHFFKPRISAQTVARRCANAFSEATTPFL